MWFLKTLYDNNPLFSLRLKVCSLSNCINSPTQALDAVIAADDCHFRSIHYREIIPQKGSPGKGQILHSQMLISPSACRHKAVSGTVFEKPTLLRMAPMTLGPWHCSRLSWLTGWWRIRFLINSKKAAMLFDSKRPSEKENRANQSLWYPELATTTHVHYNVETSQNESIIRLH